LNFTKVRKLTITPQAKAYWSRTNPTGIRSKPNKGEGVAEILTFDYHGQFRIDSRATRIIQNLQPLVSPNDVNALSNFVVNALTTNL